MRAALILALATLALPLAATAAPAQEQARPAGQGGSVVVRYPPGNCGISLAKENWLESVKARGGEPVSEVFGNGADAMKKLRALKSAGICK